MVFKNRVAKDVVVNLGGKLMKFANLVNRSTSTQIAVCYLNSKDR